MMVTVVSGILDCLSIDHIDDLCKQSKAFRKSMKFNNNNNIQICKAPYAKLQRR